MVEGAAASLSRLSPNQTHREKRLSSFEQERERWQKGKRGLLGPGADRGTVERKRKGSPRWYRRGTGSRDVRGEEIYVAPDWIVLTRSRRLLFALPRFSPELSSPFTFSLPPAAPPRDSPRLSFALFPSGSIRTVDRTPRFQTVRLWNVILPRFLY